MRMVSSVAWPAADGEGGGWRASANLFSAGFDRLALGWRVRSKVGIIVKMSHLRMPCCWSTTSIVTFLVFSALKYEITVLVCPWCYMFKYMTITGNKQYNCRKENMIRNNLFTMRVKVCPSYEKRSGTGNYLFVLCLASNKVNNVKCSFRPFLLFINEHLIRQKLMNNVESSILPAGLYWCGIYITYITQ